MKELIPEFFYLPDFLDNRNYFDMGATQRGKPVRVCSARCFVRVTCRTEVSGVTCRM